MSKFSFWATLLTAVVLGLVGFWLGGTLPFLTPFTINQSRLIFTLLGILIGLSAFGRVSAWIVTTTTSLVTRLVARLAMEITNQVISLATRGKLAPLLSERFNPEVKADLTDLIAAGTIILDTSSIIDGRLLEVAKAGFLWGVIILPKFVLLELQQVSDSADNVKRARGRRGFEIINNLKKIPGIKLQNWDDDVKGKEVDEKLVNLGKKLHGRILTCDFNLNRVASLSGVGVLNINELANSLKTLPVPGERLDLKVIQTGKDRDQGVGYLSDGTMVVIKNASSFIGQDIAVEVAKILQGPSGRIIFGRVAD